MPDPLDVLPLDKAKEHLNREKFRDPDDEGELVDMIGAAVKRVRRHLGGRQPSPIEADEVLACKVVLAEYWRTQRPGQARATYAGQVGPNADDGPTSGASIRAKLTDILGEPVAAAETQPQGSFPPPAAWPDPVRTPVVGWPR